MPRSQSSTRFWKPRMPLIPGAQANGEGASEEGSIMARQLERHGRDPARVVRKAPPCMWRGPGMELSDELYAQQPLQGPRGRVEGSMSCSNVLHLNVETTRGR